jgi:phosphomannomutase
MALIKSISGIRGTIGGKPGESLSPVDIVKFAAAFGTWVQLRHKKDGLKSLWDATPANQEVWLTA